MTITSTNLASVPFLSHTDSTRLQMSAKQLSQTITNLRCEVPRVIGNNFRYLSDSTRMFKETAPTGGYIIHENDEIMVVIFNTPSGEFLEIYETPLVMECTGLYATKLRYRRETGPFQVGDLLYEYDCFKNSIPTYGYNVNVCYMPWFGYNHEDSIVISESLANRCRSTKTETIVIPIYTYSLFKMIYDDPRSHKFIPGLGQKIDGNTIACKSMLKSSRNVVQTLKSMNITDFTNAVNNELQFNSIPIHSRIENASVYDLRVHRINRLSLIDKNLQSILENVYDRFYTDRIRSVYGNFKSIFNEDYARNLLSRYYVLGTGGLSRKEFNLKELVYIIEIKLSSEDKSHIGDKFANRYANKGIVSLILPDELRPYAMHSKVPIDYITGPITTLSRMNLGQLFEGVVSKAITKAQTEILRNPRSSPDILRKISKIADILTDPMYSHQIIQLAQQVETDDIRLQQFVNSVREMGLYYEAPNFANFDNNVLIRQIEGDFGITPEEPIMIKREAIKMMAETLNIDIPLPKEDHIILKDVFTAPIYTIKLKQEAKSKFGSRDFGSYKATNRQPVQGKSKGGGSRLGQMEFDGLLGHGVEQVIRELRTVKNDSQGLKPDLSAQILTNGSYSLPMTMENVSYTKLIIDTLVEFLNS